MVWIRTKAKQRRWREKSNCLNLRSCVKRDRKHKFHFIFQQNISVAEVKYGAIPSGIISAFFNLVGVGSLPSDLG